MLNEFDSTSFEVEDIEQLLERCQVEPVQPSPGLREQVLTAGAAAHGRARLIEQIQITLASVAAVWGFLLVGSHYINILPRPAVTTGMSAQSVFADHLDELSTQPGPSSVAPEWTMVEASIASRQFSSAVLAGIYTGKSKWPPGS